MGDPDRTAASLKSAMVRLLQETDSADVTLVCEDKEWKLHSTVLGMRSTFFKAAIVNDMTEKKEKKIIIKDLDPKTVGEVVNYMHGRVILDLTKFSQITYFSSKVFSLVTLHWSLICLAETRAKHGAALQRWL